MEGWKVVGERNIQMYHFDRSHRIFNDVRQFLRIEGSLPKTHMLVVNGWKVVGERDIQMYHVDRYRMIFNDVGQFLKDED